MKDKQKSLEIAMEYQILRDQETNRYCQLRSRHTIEELKPLGMAIYRLQTLFELWAELSSLLTRKGGTK